MSADVALDAGGFNAVRLCRWGPMLYNKHDVYIGRSLERYGEYSWLEFELFTQIVKPGQVVLEAGANIGAHTVGLSRLVGAGGAVLAFEPLRLVFQALCANLAMNQCANVWAMQQALGAANGMTPVPSVDPLRPNNFGGLTLIGAQGNDLIPLRTVDSLELGVCHLLKADVEGMEIELLQGARNTIARCRPALYVENDRKERSAALIEQIMQLGYELYWHLPPLFNPANFAGESENLFPGIVSTNMICFPSEAKANVQGFRRIASPQDRWNA